MTFRASHNLSNQALALCQNNESVTRTFSDLSSFDDSELIDHLANLLFEITASAIFHKLLIELTLKFCLNFPLYSARSRLSRHHRILLPKRIRSCQKAREQTASRWLTWRINTARRRALQKWMTTGILSWQNRGGWCWLRRQESIGPQIA